MENQIVIQAKSGLKDLENLKSQIDEIGKNCQQIKVTDEVTLAISQQNLSKANNMLSLIESKHKEIKAPYLEAGRLCDNTKKVLVEELNKGISHIKGQVGDWEKKRLEEEAKKKADLAAKLETNQITPETAAQQVKVLQEQSSLSATKNIRYNPSFELIDISQVPKEWLTINEEVVKEYMKSIKDDLTPEGKVINGVKFFKKMSVVS